MKEKALRMYANAIGELGDEVVSGLLLSWDGYLIDTGRPVLDQPLQRRVKKEQGRVLVDLSLPRDGAVPTWEALLDRDFLWELGKKIGGRMGEDIEQLAWVCFARSWVEEAEKNTKRLSFASLCVKEVRGEEQQALTNRLRRAKNFERFCELFGVPNETRMVEISSARAASLLSGDNVNAERCLVYVCHRGRGRPVATVNCHANPRRYACCTTDHSTAVTLTYGGQIREGAYAISGRNVPRGYSVGLCPGGHRQEITQWLADFRDLRFFVPSTSRWAQ